MKINPINSAFLMPNLSAQKTQNYNYNTRYLTPIKGDSVSFTGKKFVMKPVNVALDKAKFVANSLSTSTSGHRAPYLSENFTKEIVNLITLGVAGYSIAEAAGEGRKATVMIGGDTRQATRESLPEIRETLLKQGVNVINIEEPVPTPLLAMAARDYNVDLAVLMTASHNPWADGGYNLVTAAGAIAPADVTGKVANHMVQTATIGSYKESSKPYGEVTQLNPYELYKSAIEKSGLINWENIRNSGIEVYYDGLQGTGVYVMPRLLNDYKIPFVEVKSKGQEGPNPTDKNLGELKSAIKMSESPLKVGLANDGDADRFGIVDEKGNFINANDVILLVGYHLAQNLGKEGATIRSQATSMQLDKLADLYGLDKYETPVGFKYIAEDIIDIRKEGSDILVAGEESGGLTVNGHIPEKDGIIALLLIMDLIAKEGKPVSEILSKVKGDLGVSIVINNFSKRMSDEATKNAIMAKVEEKFNDAVYNGVNEFGPNHHIDSEATAELRKKMEHYRKGGDGYKFILTDGSTVLMRKSGTEPLVKCYIEAAGKNAEEAKANSEALEAYMNEFFKI